MLIKAADDKQPAIDALEALLSRPALSAEVRRRIDNEIRNIRAGAKGERDAAYEIEFYLAKSRNQMTIHDLRIELDGRIAQIDHLIINRVLDIWVLESKHFADGVAINEHGEWEALYGRNRRGIPSPIEQNARHIAVIKDVFGTGLVQLPKRLGITIKPRLSSLVLVSNNARISRPKGRAALQVTGIDQVIKVDQLMATIDRDFNKKSTTALAKVVSSDTIERLARALAGLHVQAPSDWATRFGLPPAGPPPAAATPMRAPAGSEPSQAQGSEATDPRRVCATCGRPVSDKELAWCLSHVERFSGSTYCFDCQRQVRRAGA